MKFNASTIRNGIAHIVSAGLLTLSLLSLCLISLSLLSCGLTSTKQQAAPLDDGLMGFATQNPDGPPTGGAGPNGINCTATDINEFNLCLKKMHKKSTLDQPFTLFVKGVIDGAINADGSGYSKAVIKRSNLSLIGIVENNTMPTLKAVWIIAKGKKNLIVRNLRMVTGRDHELVEPEEGCPVSDTDYCDWNAEPDGLTVQATQGVWIDHCEFTDGPDYDGINPNKSHYKAYDGLLDIKRGANYVTVSYSTFSNHDKSILIGHSDKHDSDNFHVTFYRNHFYYLGQRAPRVRHGKIHLLNNLYENKKKKEYHQKYYLTYTIGMGFKSQVYSERNVFDIPGVDANKILDVSEFSRWAQHFTDTGSWLNGEATDLNLAAKQNIEKREAERNKGLNFIGKVEWSPSYNYKSLNNPAQVRATVKQNAGVGIITPASSP